MAAMSIRNISDETYQPLRAKQRTMPVVPRPKFIAFLTRETRIVARGHWS